MASRQILTFIAMSLGILTIAVDIAAVNVAIPAIEASFKTSVETIQWVVNGYILSFGVLMVTFGRLADTFGRRKIFFAGLIVFGLSSLAGALSADSAMLIAARVFQGAGGAMLWPCILGIVYSSVSDDQKGFAGGLILGAAGVGNAAGPLIGGVLTEFASWRWVLFVNVPICVIAGIITYLEVEKDIPESEEASIDYAGIAAVSVSLVSLLYALNLSPDWGWASYKTISLLVIFAAVMAVFIVVEFRARDGLIPLDVMKNFQFIVCGTIMFTLVPGFFTVLLYVTQYLEKFPEYSPLKAGAALVPQLLSFAIMAPVSGRIYNRLGARLSIFTGMALSSAGLLLIAFIGLDSGFYWLLPGFIISGAGIGFAVPSITTAAVSTVSQSRASLAGGIIYMFQLVGGAFGLAVVTTIFTDFANKDLLARLNNVSEKLSDAELRQISDFITGSGTNSALEQTLGADRFQSLYTHIHHAYISGVDSGLYFTAAFAALGALLALLFVRMNARASNAA